ncbi:MAG TPA: beta-propeller fold lactonase family protein [Stellaceae bacterium]|nr:beta-propeller fold lactonase family protein [Stellaceae bacterium]
MATTHVYVSNAEDGEIGTYRMAADGTLTPGARVLAGKQVMPMAVSPDRRFLYAVSRAEPYRVHAFAIDPATGALAPLGASPLEDTLAYISLDQTGKHLFGASYAGHQVTVHAIGADGRVAAPARQIIPIGRNAHSIRADRSNRYVFAASLGHDSMFQFAFDAASGFLVSNTPSVATLPPGTGPRHFITQPDNRFVYALSELKGTVTSFALDQKTGHLTEISSVSILPPGSTLRPGAPRGPDAPPRNTENDIWCADIHLTPDGTLLFASERTTSILFALRVDPATGTLTYLGSAPTERQPRGFAIDPSGRFIVASGEKSQTLSVHAIDRATGGLRLVGKYPGGKGANWVEIVALG